MARPADKSSSESEKTTSGAGKPETTAPDASASGATEPQSESKGDSAGVKTFARTLVDDHTTAKAQALSIAEKLGVAPPAGGKPEG